MADFTKFQQPVANQIADMAKTELFVVDITGDEVWDAYLNAFPAGTNEIFRVRNEHDCSTDKNFIRNMGNVVSFSDGKLRTIWDVETIEPYATVTAVLSALVRSKAVKGVFRTKMPSYGNEKSRATIDGTLYNFQHFYTKLPSKYVVSDAPTVCGKINTAAQVFERGLEELAQSAIETVLDLIADKALYRGDEHKPALTEFLALKDKYRKINDPVARSAFVWEHVNSKAARFRNTVIGTLVQDLTDGMELEKAVKRFEDKVAPQNYKRPKALITQKMVEQAADKLRELGMEDAVNRRYARIEDVSINDVLFVDNTVQPLMKDGIEGLLAGSVKKKTVNIETAQPIGIESFMSDVVPNSKKIDLMVDNRHAGNFMSVTAPQDADTGGLFQWDNDFAWSYEGDIADSDMRQAVAAAGGRVDGVFRFTHSWNHEKRNASLMDLHVFMPGNGVRADNSTNERYGNDHRVGWNHRKHHASGGVQDVDYTAAAPSGYIPVENITFPSIDKMPDGEYVCKVHNWSFRPPTNGGFRAEIEFQGQVFEYEYDAVMKNHEWVTVAVVTLKKGVFTIEHHLPTTSAQVEKWGVTTNTLVPVDTMMMSPNHWGESEVGNKHWFFILKGCENPAETRGIYNEFLNTELAPHRKVFEVLGSKTKCAHAPAQLSGVGFSSTRREKATVVADGRAYEIMF